MYPQVLYLIRLLAVVTFLYVLALGIQITWNRPTEVPSKPVQNKGASSHALQSPPSRPNLSWRVQHLMSTEPELPGWERNVSLNASDYVHYEESTVLITPEFSGSGSDTKVLIVVFTDPKRIEYRSAIRQTSGKDCKEHPDCDLLFLVGIPEADNDNRNDQRQLDREAELYRDILQENFKDTYLNFTIKALFMYKYFNSADIRYRYLFKVNDDNFFSVPGLFGILSKPEELQLGSEKPVVMGHVWPVAKPFRLQLGTSRYGRWAVPYYQYPYESYPKYLPGGALLFNRAACICHYKAALNVKLLIVEDVYITGLLGEPCHTRRISSPSFHPFDDPAGYKPNLHVAFHETSVKQWFDWYKFIPRGSPSSPLEAYAPKDFSYKIYD